MRKMLRIATAHPLIANSFVVSPFESLLVGSREKYVRPFFYLRKVLEIIEHLDSSQNSINLESYMADRGKTTLFKL